MDLVAVGMWAAPFLFGLLGWAIKRWIKDIVAEMNQKVDEATKPIQVGANGGWSLPDAIRLLNRIDGKIDRLHNEVGHLRGRFDEHVKDGH